MTKSYIPLNRAQFELEADLFWALVERGEADDCWLWRGGSSTAANGKYPYGRYSSHSLTFMAHRVAYVLAIGEIPEGMTLDHVKARGCKGGLCCNPSHLEPVTQEENSRRGQYEGELCACGKPRNLKLKSRRCTDCYNAYHRAHRKANPQVYLKAAHASYERKGRETRKARYERKKQEAQ